MSEKATREQTLATLNPALLQPQPQKLPAVGPDPGQEEKMLLLLAFLGLVALFVVLTLGDRCQAPDLTPAAPVSAPLGPVGRRARRRPRTPRTLHRCHACGRGAVRKLPSNLYQCRACSAAVPVAVPECYRVTERMVEP